ncbi:hypothetical protein UPYG_G00085750 [Umbra pygmaea]|uniref:Uncharacterized protein n=1 Tax=Umbra pygmaea TaxID=75934 RepID=A0ABD0XI04_UMBPY
MQTLQIQLAHCSEIRWVPRWYIPVFLFIPPPSVFIEPSISSLKLCFEDIIEYWLITFAQLLHLSILTSIFTQHLERRTELARSRADQKDCP